MAGYTRQSSYTDGDVINASDSNDEFDQLLAAFNNATGHAHDGTSAEGPVIGLIGDAGVTTPLNKIVVDSVNNRVGVFVDVASSAVEQLRIQDGAVVPVTDNDIDLGASGAEFKDLYIDGVAYVDSLAMPTTTVTDILDEDTMSSDSASALATQQSIKAYVDSQVTAQDLDFQGDTGGALSIDLDSETFTVAGGTGIDTAGSGNTLTVNIDSTVATLTGTQTLTNKSIDADNNTITNLEVDNLKSGVLDTDLTTVAATDTTLASAKAIKTYVDAQVTAQDLDLTTDSGTIDIDLDSETLTVAGGTGIDSSATGTTVTLAIDSTVATLTGTQTLTNKTLTTPVISTISNTGTLTLPTSTDTIVGRATTDTLTNKTIDADNNTVSNLEVDNLKSGVLDTDLTSVAATDTTIPSAKAVKTYVDAQVTAQDLDLTTDSGTIAIDLDSETLTVAGTSNEIETSATGNTVTIGLPDSVTIKQLTLNPDTNVGKVLALTVQQGDVLKFGDTELYQDRTSGVHYIVNPVASDALVVGGDSTIIMDSTRNKALSRFDFSGGNGTSYIGYYDSSTGYSAKLQTTNTGVTISGTASATTFSGDLNGTINSATTATTQSAGTNNTTVATTTFANTAADNAAVALAIALG